MRWYVSICLYMAFLSIIYLFFDLSKGINYPRPIACIPPVGPIINQVLGNGNSKSVLAALGQNAHPTFSHSLSTPVPRLPRQADLPGTAEINRDGRNTSWYGM